MPGKIWIIVAATLTLLLAGCGSSEVATHTPVSTQQPATPLADAAPEAPAATGAATGADPNPATQPPDVSPGLTNAVRENWRQEPVEKHKEQFIADSSLPRLPQQTELEEIPLPQPTLPPANTEVSIEGLPTFENQPWNVPPRLPEPALPLLDPSHQGPVLE